MKLNSVAWLVVVALVLSVGACSSEVVVSTPSEDTSSEEFGAVASQASDGASDETKAEAPVEVELTEAEKAVIEKAEAAALEVRQSFDQLVFGCGQDRDFSRCVELREQLDVEALAELETRCDISDLVACEALTNTVVADLQVECVYEGNEDSCQALDSVWGLDAESNYGLSESVADVNTAALNGDCDRGGVVECAELNARS